MNQSTIGGFTTSFGMGYTTPGYAVYNGQIPVYGTDGKQIGYTRDPSYVDNSMFELPGPARSTGQIFDSLVINGDLEVRDASPEAVKRLREKNPNAESRNPTSKVDSEVFQLVHKVMVVGLQFSPEKGFFYKEKDGSEEKLGDPIIVTGRLTIL